MMKRNSSIFIGWQTVTLALALALCGLPEPAYCEIDSTALLLQQTPPQGGEITPSIGVHYFELYTEITLTAVPKPGYHFVCWLGDVSDLTAESTIVYLDVPKIVIAVFERAEYESLAEVERPKSTPIGGLRRSGPDYGGGRGVAGAGRPREQSWPAWPGWWPTPKDKEKPEEGNFPIPEEEKSVFPVPKHLPEPATGALLVLGSLFAFVRRKAGR